MKFNPPQKKVGIGPTWTVQDLQDLEIALCDIAVEESYKDAMALLDSAYAVTMMTRQQYEALATSISIVSTP